MKRCLGLIAGIAFTLLGSAAQAEKIVIVSPIKVETNLVSPKDVASFETALGNATRSAFEPRGWTVLTHTQALQKWREADGGTSEDCTSGTCFVRMGGALKAGAFIQTSLQHTNATFRVFVVLADFRSGELITSDSFSGRVLEEVRASIEGKTEALFTSSRLLEESSSERSGQTQETTTERNEVPKTIPVPPDVAEPPPDALRLPSGLAYRVLTKGAGTQKPGPSDKVKVHYSGWTTDGKMFDSSVTRGLPIEFPLNRVIPGWSEAVQQMVVGDRIRTWIPEDLAYQGRPGAPAGVLVFDIELLSFKESPNPPVAPEDVARPPPLAQKSKSGLVSKVLVKGTGETHPTATSRVQVHYTGWTTDGKMFDSSVVRGEPATFPLNAVIAGWVEGVQLMVEGEKRRLWIPAKLAYENKPGRPAGMLVFDIELLKIVE